MVFINGRETTKENAVSNRTCSSPHCFAVMSGLKKSGFTKKEVANRSVIVATWSSVKLRQITSCFFGLRLTNKLIFGLWFHWFKDKLTAFIQDILFNFRYLIFNLDVFTNQKIKSIAGVLHSVFAYIVLIITELKKRCEWLSIL